jgi:hypothetical protein
VSEEETPVSIDITNVSGQKVNETIFLRLTNGIHQIPFNHLDAGVYLVSLKYNGQLISRKFIKN